MFNKNTSALLDKLFYNLPAVVFITTILIRLLVAVPVALVSVEKFSFFNNVFAQFALGILSVILLEILLTVLSIITANFRKNKEDEATAFVLIFVVIITAYNGYMLHSVNQFYDVKFEFSALLTLHLLNIASVVLIETIAYIQAKNDVKPLPNQTVIKKVEPVTKNYPKPNPSAPIELVEPVEPVAPKQNKIIIPKTTDLSQNIINLHLTGKQGKEIAEMLNTNTSKVCRVLKEYKNTKND